MGTSIRASGGATWPTVQTLTGTGNVAAWTSVVIVHSAGAATVTLPAVLVTGASITVRNTGTGSVAVSPFAGNTLVGQSSISAGSAVTYTGTAIGTATSMQDAQPAATTVPVTSVNGYFDAGDIGGGTTGALPVSGQVISAVKTNVNGGSNYVVTIPDMGNTTYPLWIYPEGLGAAPWDSSNTSLIVGHTKSSTSFQIFMKDDDVPFLAGGQSLRINVYAMSSMPTATTVVVPAGAASVSTDITFSAAADTAVPTTLAVKTYVDENTQAPVVKTYTAGATYTPTVGLKWAQISLCGAGGGGAGAAATNSATCAVGAGGGGGGWVVANFTAAQIGAAQGMTIGTGGAAGAAGAAGGAGGNTSFGTLLTCTGGGGGNTTGGTVLSAAIGGAGGVISTNVGAFVWGGVGTPGGTGVAAVITNSNYSTVTPGGGGCTGLFGAGARPDAVSGATSIVVGIGSAAITSPSAGGGGAGAGNAGTAATARAGAAGGGGRIQVVEYF